MKKRHVAAALTAGLLLLGGAVLPARAAQTDDNPNSYWSRNNAPVIYGTSKITIPKDTVFDVMDPRFRVMAKDFEDGDLTQGLESESTVNTAAAGNYTITYTVTDAHDNRTELVVPVTVTDSTEDKIKVERTMYTTPSVWNMTLAGTNRGNNSDRQHLGIFMPEDSSIRMRVVNGTGNFTVNLYNDDRLKESEIRVPSEGGEWVDISNQVENEGVTDSYDCVPMVFTPIMERGAAINTVYKIEIEYGSDVKALNYYVYGDDEDAFRARWNEEKDSIGVIENEVMTLVMPYEDLARTTNYFQGTKGFTTLDDYLDYYYHVVNKMDEMLGLEFDPEDPIDQNVRTRYVVKMNVHGWGMAYYSGSHVGYNYYGQSEGHSMANFFSVDWCGLHEFAHGYQGTMAGGGRNMNIGEVGNNIICYYIQGNRELYPYEESWLGNIPQKENDFNRNRLETGIWIDEPVSQLYMVINLLDRFEGEDTYPKIFQWYRRQLQNGRTVDQTDIFTEAIADIYDVNIIPYMEAWGLTVGEDCKNEIYERKLPTINILSDMVTSSTLSEIMDEYEIAEKFEIVYGDVFQNVMGTSTIHVDIDSMDAIRGKKLRILDGNDIVREVVVNTDTIEIEDIAVGTYTLQMPVSGEHSNDGEYLKVTESGTEQTVSYTRLDDYVFNNALAIKLRGNYETYGYELTFNEDFTSAHIKLGGASMGTTEPYVKIYNTEDEEVSSEAIVHTGNPYYFDHQKAAYDIPVEPGYKIVVYHPMPERVRVFSNLTGAMLSTFMPASGEKTTTYFVTEGGLRKESMTEEAAADALYDILKAVLEEVIREYQENADPEEIDDAYSNRAKKEEVLIAYGNLREEDQEVYQELIDQLSGAIKDSGDEGNGGDDQGGNGDGGNGGDDQGGNGDEGNGGDNQGGNGDEGNGGDDQGGNGDGGNGGDDQGGNGDEGNGGDNQGGNGDGGNGGDNQGGNGDGGNGEDETPLKWPFSDVEEIKGNWKYESVKYVYIHGIMNGISGTSQFQPDNNLTRAMFATVLYRLHGEPAVTIPNPFPDVKDGQWYTNGVLWVAENGIASGYTNGNFGVDDEITREQIAKMLFEYGKVRGLDVTAKKDLGGFTDTETVNGWAVDYVKWAVATAMISGKPNGDDTFRLAPRDPATRAECAKMLKMFSEAYSLK